MATIRLVPSTYSLSTTSLSVSNADNFYTNTDSTTYGTVSTTSTSSRYIYVKGFNFDDIPSGAIINSFSIKFKANESGMSTSSSYRPYLVNNTTTITGTSSAITTTVTTQTFTSVSADWDTIAGYGSNFGIRFTVRKSGSGSGTGYLYLYGCEIEVDYTLPNPATVTSTLTGNGTISPSGAYSTYEGETYTLTITPTDTSETVSATKNGTDITSELVAHGAGGTESTVLGTYTLVSGGFNGSGATYFSGIVGNGHDATQTTSNYYSSGSGTTAVFQYSMAFTNIPSNATIERVYCLVNGHAESTSNSSEYMCAQLKSGNTELSAQLNFKDVGTSNSTQTLEATTLPTVSQLASMVLECTLGYYGGAINGATCYVEYSVAGSNPEYYTYTYTVTGNATIAVTIGSAPVASDKIYYKGESTLTELGTTTSTNFDDGFSPLRVTPKSTVSQGDVIVVEGTASGQYSGRTWVTDATIHIEITAGTPGTQVTDIEYQYISGTDRFGAYVLIPSSSDADYVEMNCLFQHYASSWSTGYEKGSVTFYKKIDGDWLEAIAVYKKVNGSWVEQTDLTTVFDQNTNYVKGN